jgi:hypothetical protein
MHKTNKNLLGFSQLLNLICYLEKSNSHEHFPSVFHVVESIAEQIRDPIQGDSEFPDEVLSTASARSTM